MYWANMKGILNIFAEGLILLASIASLFVLIYQFGFQQTSETIHHLYLSRIYILLAFFIGITLRYIVRFGEIIQEKLLYLDIGIYFLLFAVLSAKVFFREVIQQSLPYLDFLSKPLFVYTLMLLLSMIHLSRQTFTLMQTRIKPSLLFLLSFIFVILIGAGLLMLPNATTRPIHFVDALFTATTSVCVTGLTTVDVATTFTHIGHVIIMILIQIGGIGVMTFTSFIALSFFTQSSFNDQMALKNILSEESMNNIFRTLFYTFFTTLIIEAIGTWVIWWEIRYIPREIIPHRTFFAVFHAVSAFCNAGFSTLHDNLYNPAIRHLYGFQTWISVLIILGGIGFPIVFNYGKLINHKIRNVIYRLTGSSKRMPSHVRIVNTTTRIVITTTFFLLIGGTLLFWLFENNALLHDLPLRGKLAVSFLGATTCRTAGFNSFSIQALTAPTLALTMFLMWIGASPLSTGGGIKTTTFTIALKSIFSTLRNKENVEIFKRQIPNENIKRAYTIILLSILWIFAATLIIAALHPQNRISDILFEVISAISTVGLSIDFTPQLNTAGKIIICLTMFAGRVGLITLLSGIIHQQTSQNYTYAEENIIL